MAIEDQPGALRRANELPLDPRDSLPDRFCPELKASTACFEIIPYEMKTSASDTRARLFSSGPYEVVTRILDTAIYKKGYERVSAPGKTIGTSSRSRAP